VKLPAVESERVSVEVPEPPGRLEGLKLAIKLGSETVADNVTVPENPSREDTVMVEPPEFPGANWTVLGLAETAKSSTVNVTEVWCDRDPLVPVTLTV
jgi:hypothetical protein